MLSLALMTSTRANDVLTMVVGTYTDTGSKGIYSLSFDQNTGTATFLDSLSMINPSYLTFGRDGRMLYAVSETSDIYASLNAIAFDAATGKMTFLNKYRTGGADPCFVDVTDSMAITANYSGGSMSVFPILKDGSLARCRYIYRGNSLKDGKAPQHVPHVHAARFMPDGHILATDFSADQILLYKKLGAEVVPQGVAGRLQAGSAPRHIEHSANWKYVYVMSELGGTVTVFSNRDGKLTRLQTIASDSVGGRGGADLHLSPDGRYLYASNRLKADGISVFKVNPQTGKLRKVGYQLTDGHPRNFAITPNGRFLLCACRDGNSIQIFERDANTGLLKLQPNTIRLKKPVCIQLLKAK
mgnify:FL=1